MNRKVLIFLLAGIMMGIAGTKWLSISKGNAAEKIILKKEEANTSSINSDIKAEVAVKIPSKIYETLKYIETFHEPKDGYLGGGIFYNYEKLLPEEMANGNRINYREWDVNPKIKDKPRGKERLVTGDDKSAWYTNDHYKSFLKVH